MKVRVKKGHTITRDGVYAEGQVLEVSTADGRALVAEGRAVEVADKK